jgi:hypothetical protein
MRRVLVAIFTDDPANWIGQRMTLFCDPEVMWGGVKVGGIRISHLTGMKAPREFLQTTGRGKRKPMTIHPIAYLTPEEQQYVEEATNYLTTAETIEILEGHGRMLKDKPKPVQDALRPVYAKRLKELEDK